MDDSTRPDGSNDNPQTPQADPEIQPSSSSVPQTDLELEALLDFEPVPRRFKKEDGWTPPLQRAFIAHLARHGSPTRACEALGKVRSGATKLYKDPKGKSFRASWDKAVELAERRRAAQLCAEHSAVADLKPPFLDHRRKQHPHPFPLPQAGEGDDREVRPPLPVICDKCGAEGAAGDESFADIPDLLSFDPVPRRAHDRLWDAETQRAFIAALAVSGSPVRAARSVGRHAFGAEKLRKARGARSFNEAWEAALDIARERELARLHGKLDQLASPAVVGGEEDGQVLNELGEYEDGQSYMRRVEEARANVWRKLQRMRGNMLRDEIIPDPEKRAAWIVLNGTEEIEAVENGTWEERKRRG